MMRSHLAVGLFVALAAGSLAIGQQGAPEERPIFKGLNIKVAATRFETGEDANQTARQAARSLGVEWQVRSIDNSQGTFRLSAPPTESTAQTTPAEAWQMAHELRAKTDFVFEYVEPAFAVHGARGETTELEDCQAAIAPTESGVGSTPIPGATKDSEWSLDRDHGARVLEAWKRFPASVPPGANVWVGHPDTGYRNHPEIIGMPNGPVHPDLGWDFVDDDRDPTDAFEDGMLRWPGHGTKTSSVIVSPRGRQLPGGDQRGISGVAPGAKLIPLRVANGVVLFDPANLASAIRGAAGSDRNLVKQQVDVISISLGGPPSRALEDAVALAESNGVLVIAAAGNNVKKVIWPARYPHVIAMAASNFDSKPWSGSSGGSMVAIAAPGESVWIANPKMDGTTPLNCLSMSSGTSYATATTAGVAALWISLHRETEQFRALKKAGQLTSTFRKILQSTKRAGTNWDTGKYGPGIVDADAVLQARLPPVQESAVGPRTACDRDLAALESLLESARDRRQRASQLFGRQRAQDACAIAAVADEVAFHYATEAAVADAIDRISGRATPSAAAFAAARAALRAVASEQLQAALPER
jgi:hypothetical protein